MALIWFWSTRQHHFQYHSALDHGHYDGLHLSVFNRGHEVLHDYGFGRWVNVEPKFGGRYIQENKSYCKQTVAHNTVTVDQKTQNNFTTALAESKFGQKHFLVAGDQSLQGMSGTISEYSPPRRDMQRSVILAELPEFEKPLVIDVYRASKLTQSISTTCTVHHSGQIIPYRLRLRHGKTLAIRWRQRLPTPMERGFRQSERRRFSSKLAKDSSYYSLVTSSATAGSEVIFARTGANDPDFNLKSEPAFNLTSFGQTMCLFLRIGNTRLLNESIEASCRRSWSG